MDTAFFRLQLHTWAVCCNLDKHFLYSVGFLSWKKCNLPKSSHKFPRDCFSPVPEYFDEEPKEEETYFGNPEIIAAYFNVKQESIENYYRRWYASDAESREAKSKKRELADHNETAYPRKYRAAERQNLSFLKVFSQVCHTRLHDR